MESTAFKQEAFYQAAWNPFSHHAAWTPLHTVGIHYATMHGILCIQSRCMESTAFNRDAIYHAEWSTLHSITLHGIPCIQSGCFGPCCKKIHCIQSGCIGPRFMDSSAYSRDPLHHNAWNPLHSMTLHGIHCIQSGCFGPCLIKSTSFNDAAWNRLHSIMLHIIHCLQ